MDVGLTVAVVDAVAITGLGIYLNSQIEQLKTPDTKKIKKIEDDIKKINFKLNKIMSFLQHSHMIPNSNIMPNNHIENDLYDSNDEDNHINNEEDDDDADINDALKSIK